MEGVTKYRLFIFFAMISVAGAVSMVTQGAITNNGGIIGGSTGVFFSAIGSFYYASQNRPEVDSIKYLYALEAWSMLGLAGGFAQLTVGLILDNFGVALGSLGLLLSGAGTYLALFMYAAPK